MRVQSNVLGDLRDPRSHARWLEYVSRAINGQISYGDSINNPNAQQQNVEGNLSIWKFEGNSGVAANTAFTLKHSLSDSFGHPRIPICIVGQVTKDGGILYGDWTTWSTTTITLKSTTANTPFRLIIA